MKKSTILYLTILLIGIKMNAQELTCADFKTGKFIIPTSEELKKYTVTTKDSIMEFNSEKDSTVKKWLVIRKGKTQTEWKNGIENGNPTYEIIEWIDDCTYRLTFDSSKGEMDEMTKYVNENNGIVVSKTKIEGKCMYYTAVMTTSDGQKISQDGIICKE
tara:strand:- start:312 stop:791 length:480 start_codon:yes stop_codon:yes gene_type:complete